MATLQYSAKKLQLLIPNAKRHTQKSFQRDNISVRPSNVDDIVEAIYKDLASVAAATGITQSIVSLTDTPSAYSGDTDKILGVNGSDNGTEFKGWKITGSTIYPTGSGGNVGKSGGGVGKLYFDSAGNIDHQGDLGIYASGVLKSVFKQTTGYFGAGLTNPLEPLHSVGGIVISSAVQASGGSLQYSSGYFQGHDGSVWKSFMTENLAYNNLLQSSGENRTYNINDQSIKFYNGSFIVEDTAFKDVFTSTHGGGKWTFGGALGTGTGGSNMVHQQTQQTNAGAPQTSALFEYRDYAGTVGLRFANWYQLGGLNHYSSISYGGTGSLYMTSNGGILIGSPTSINIGYNSANRKPLEVNLFSSTQTKLSSTAGILNISGSEASGSTTFTDKTDTKTGIKYAGNYNGTLVGLSLITKDYADANYAPSGGSGVTNIVIGTPTATTNVIGSSTGTSGTLSGASSTYAGLLTSAKFDEIGVNNNKVGITSAQATILSNTSGTNTGDQDISGISSNANNISTLNGAVNNNSSAIALLSTNVTTNLSEGTSTTTTVDVNSSDGTNATLSAASTSRAGVMTKAKFDEVVANNAKTGITSAQTTKLSNIETAADVTDTTNVVAALTAGTNVTISGAGVIAATGGGVSGIADYVRAAVTSGGASASYNSGDQIIPMTVQSENSNATKFTITSNGVKVNQAGRYRINCATTINSTSVQRANPIMRITVNNTVAKDANNQEYQSNEHYARAASNINNSTANLDVIIDLATNDIVRVILVAGSNTAVSNVSITSTGSFLELSEMNIAGVNVVAQTLNKTLTLEEPVNGDNITLFRTDVPITVKEVISVLVGSGTPVVHQLYHHGTRNSAAANLLTTSQSVSTQLTGTVSTLSDDTVPADSWVWVKFTAPTTATAGQYITIDIRYTE